MRWRLGSTLLVFLMIALFSPWGHAQSPATEPVTAPPSAPVTKPVTAPVTAPTQSSIRLRVPEPVSIEHAAIRSELIEATRARGRVGVTARKLAKVLFRHFEREEELALPALGLLRALSRGERIPRDVAADAMAMTDQFRAEMPAMLAEHQEIHALVLELNRVARIEHATRVERFTRLLARHAQTEEEVMYPAVLLVGDLLRAQYPEPVTSPPQGPPRPQSPQTAR